MIVLKGGEDMDTGIAILVGLIVGAILHALLSQGMIYKGLQDLAESLKNKRV